MRVLHVIPAVAARYGGPGVVAVETVRALRAAGHDALIATTDADGDGRLDVPTGSVVEWSGVPVIAQPLGGGERFKWSSALGRWLRTHVGEFDLVDIHAVFSHSSVAAGLACRRAHVPYVVRPHGALDPWSLSRKSFRKRLLLSWGGRQLLEGAAFVQYTTATEQALAMRALPWLSAGRVVPPGVDDGCFAEPSPDTQTPYVLTMSRLEAKKSLEPLIDAFHTAAAGALGHWRLVVAGAGKPDYVERLHRRAAAGPAAARITFPGWVSGAVRRALVSGASLFASPSAQENFGLSVAEAMAAGVPVLVTPEVNLSDAIVGAGAGWVAARESTELARTLAAVFEDPAGRLSRGRSARQLAEGFRWSSSVSILLGVYDETLAARRSHSYG